MLVPHYHNGSYRYILASNLRAVHASCQIFSFSNSDIPFWITVIYGPLNDLSKIYRLLWVLTKTLNIHWILEEAPQTNLLYFVTSNIRFFQQKKRYKRISATLFQKNTSCSIDHYSLPKPTILGFLNPPSSIFRAVSDFFTKTFHNIDRFLPWFTFDQFRVI